MSLFVVNVRAPFAASLSSGAEMTWKIAMKTGSLENLSRPV